MLGCVHIEGKQIHQAIGMPPDTAGRPRPWRSRIETGGASWGTTVAAPLYTTCWGLLKQPDNQKLATFRRKIPFSQSGHLAVGDKNDKKPGSESCQAVK